MMIYAMLICSAKFVSFNFFWYFATDWIFKKLKGSPFYKFKNLALFWALDIAPTLDVPVLFKIDPPQFFQNFSVNDSFTRNFLLTWVPLKVQK